MFKKNWVRLSLLPFKLSVLMRINLDNWQLQFHYEIEGVTGRVLPGEEIRMRNGQTYRYPSNNTDWGAAFMGKIEYSLYLFQS